ncbi:MAG: hypothetical protein AAGK74_10015 [Chloroflexota bacterium]
MGRAFEDEVKYHLTLSAAPDYTAKGDATIFFKINAKRALPIPEKLAASGNVGAK